MKVLIIGASSLLGGKLFEILSQKYEVIGTYYTHNINSCIPMNITDPISLREILTKIRADVVINSVAITNTDYGETHKKEAYLVNFRAVRHLAKFFNGKIVQISTDYVFDGEKGFYSEYDSPNPLNYYGLTKLMAETLLQSSKKDSLIIRVSGLYGYNKQGYNKFIECNIHNSDVKACFDLISSPTLTDDVAKGIMHLLEADENGIFHIAGPKAISRYEFQCLIKRVFKLNGRVIPVFAEEVNFIAKRPKNSSLTMTKLNVYTHDPISGLYEVLKSMRSNNEVVSKHLGLS
jgi:dTDP-4-dehydrorhamnose reductase